MMRLSQPFSGRGIADRLKSNIIIIPNLFCVEWAVVVLYFCDGLLFLAMYICLLLYVYVGQRDGKVYLRSWRKTVRGLHKETLGEMTGIQLLLACAKLHSVMCQHFHLNSQCSELVG